MDTVNEPFFGHTDVGKVRKNNEDAFIAQYIWDEKHILAVAIDGVGGYEGGEVAAALAEKKIVEYLEDYPNGDRVDLLKQAVDYANDVIIEQQEAQPQYYNMNCVLTAILVEVEKRCFHMVHVGDTRLYQYADGVFKKLSHDQSLVGYMEDNGHLTEEQAMNHPRRNVIENTVGDHKLKFDGFDKDVEVNTFPLLPNSTLLLCSDGLCDMITSHVMKAELDKDLSIKDKVNNLIAAANNAGGRDNVTVVLVETKNLDVFSEIETQTQVDETSDAQMETDEDSQELKVHSVESQELKVHSVESHDLNVHSVESHDLNVHSVESIDGQSTDKPHRRSHVGCYIFWTALAICCVIGAYLLGGYAGSKLTPSLFYDSRYVDTIVKDVRSADRNSETDGINATVESVVDNDSVKKEEQSNDEALSNNVEQPEKVTSDKKSVPKKGKPKTSKQTKNDTTTLSTATTTNNGNTGTPDTNEQKK